MKKKILIVAPIVIFILVFINYAFAVDQIKSTDTFITSGDGAVSSATSTSFTLYIGDNLSGVTNPIKSVYFAISGVYTGNSGTLKLDINGDASTAKTFTLPDVGSTPTPFEIMYKDDTNKINPASAGSYAYTLNTTPTNVTVYGLGAKMTETHRYKPPACGGAYPATGELISRIFDTGTDGAAYNSVMWKGALGGPSQNQGKARLKIATSDSDGGPWNYRGPETTCSTNTTSDSDWYVAAADTPVEVGCYSYHNNKRYFRYQIQICSSSDCSTGGEYTPQVDDVIISWSP
ncbi:MAG: hypothetical protein HZA37_01740 [Parcubacteria group bacterium]|nr:hypothetical protein [Parcubacteria group bacterium]